MLKAHKAGNIESYKESKLPINDRNNRIIRKTYLSEWGKMGNDWAIVGQIGHSVQCQVVRKLILVVRLITTMERVRNVFPHYSPNPQNGDMGNFQFKRYNLFDWPAHAGLNRIGKAVFVIPPLCSQKHTHKGKTSSLKKISTPRYASGSIFSSALVATASTLIHALQ